MDVKLTKVEKDSWQQEVVLVGLLLDPCIKTTAFPNPEEKLRATEVLKKYAGFYTDRTVGISKDTAVSAPQPVSIRSMFIETINSGSSVQQTEVDKYLGSSAEPICNPLSWWKSRSTVYPVLSRMVIDFLAVCASSVDAERWFSHGGKVVTSSRSSLDSSTVQAAMCLKSWYGFAFPCVAEVDLSQ